jgi:hypothetical protein
MAVVVPLQSPLLDVVLVAALRFAEEELIL